MKLKLSEIEYAELRQLQRNMVGTPDRDFTETRRSSDLQSKNSLPKLAITEKSWSHF